MKTTILLSLFIALTCLPLMQPVYAQNPAPCTVALDLAANEFANGYFETAADRIYTCLGRQTMTDDQELRAYMLLGRIYYASLKHEEARDSIRRALEKNPALQIVAENDKPGFVAMVEDVKQNLGINPLPPEKPMPQTEYFRKGLWFSISLGPGNAEIDCDGCGTLLNDDPWKGGASFTRSLSIGGAVSPKWLLGVELNNWGRTDGFLDREASITFLGAVAQFYPSSTGNFHIIGGIGIGGVEVKGPAVTLDTGSGGLLLGIGYDILLGNKNQFAVTPTLKATGFLVKKVPPGAWGILNSELQAPRVLYLLP